MAYKLVIANTVKVPVNVTLNDAGNAASFSFSVNCERLTQDEIRESINDKEELISAFLQRVIKGWSDQTIVVDEFGNPAGFNTESLALLLGIAGMSAVIYRAYLKECGAKEKN